MLTMLVLSHIGLALLLIGYGWLLVSAFRVKAAWGLVALVPPGQWLFVLLHKGKGWQALLAQVMAVGMILLPAMEMISDPVLATHYANKRYSLQCCDFSKPVVVAEPMPEDPTHPLLTLDNLLTPEKLEEIEANVRADVQREQVRKEQAAAAAAAVAPPVEEPPKPIYTCKDANGHTVFTDLPCDKLFQRTQE